MQGLPFPVSAKNDEIACLRGQGTVAGLLGLELKKDLERKVRHVLETLSVFIQLV